MNRRISSTRARLGLAAVLSLAFCLPATGVAHAATCPTVDAVTHAVTPSASAGVDWSGCDLSGAALSGAILSGANLRGANLSNAVLAGADLTGAVLATVIVTESTWWGGATCPDASPADSHDRRSCLTALDTTAPTGVRLGHPRTAFQAAFEGRLITQTAEDVGGSGLRAYEDSWAQQTAAGGTLTPWVHFVTSPAASHTFNGVSGMRYCFRVRAVDYAGNWSGWSAVRCTSMPTSLRATTASRGWVTAKGSFHPPGEYYFSSALTYRTTRVHGASMTTRTVDTVRQVGLLATVCGSCGSVDVYIGSRYVGRISLKGTYDRVWPMRMLVLKRLPKALHGKVKLVVASTHRTVQIEALLVTAY